MYTYFSRIAFRKISSYFETITILISILRDLYFFETPRNKEDNISLNLNYLVLWINDFRNWDPELQIPGKKMSLATK